MDGKFVQFFAFLVFLACGCENPTATNQPNSSTSEKPVSLKVFCSDRSFAKSLSSRCVVWAGNNNAKIEVISQGSPDESDIAIIHPDELGLYAAKGFPAAVPQSLRGAEHSVHWSGILDVYGSTLSSWAGQVCAIPIAGEAYVLVYRADLFSDNRHSEAFSGKYGHRLRSPATWEEFEEIAAYFTEAGKKPALPPLPVDGARLLIQFNHVAACYDRERMTDRQESKSLTDIALSFHVQAGTWKNRLDAPCFSSALGLFNRLSKYRPSEPDNDQVKALDQGSAVVAVLSLAEVGRLPHEKNGEVSKRFGLGKLPGGKFWFDAEGKKKLAATEGNYVPYLGSSGLIGIVSTKSTEQNTAWKLLSEFASAAASSTSISEPSLGFGPFRTEHIEREKNQIWLRYGFDSDRSDQLDQAVRHFLGGGIINPVIALRTPDRAAKSAALETQVRQVALGKTSPEEALQRAMAAWDKLDDVQKPEELTKWRRNAANQK